MNYVKRLIKADNALMRSGPVGLAQKMFYAIYIMLMLYPIAMAVDGYNGDVLHFNVLLGAFYSVLMFLYSGYFPMADNRTMGKGFCYTFIRSAYFMPFKKSDYIKAAFIQWVKIYLVFLASQIAAMVILMINNGASNDMVGAVYFMTNIFQIITGIETFLPIILGQKKLTGNFWWYLNCVLCVVLMLAFGAIMQFVPEAAVSALGWYCSVWGIIGGIAVVPVVGAALALIFHTRRKYAWFRG